MPMPWTYRHASREFEAFLADVRERMDLASSNMAYTAVDGVFQVFRRRLTAQQGLDFADTLPAVLRAIFVHDWDVSGAPLPFTDRASLAREAQALRRHHNLTPDNAIEATAWAVRRCVDQATFDRVLTDIGPQAQAFWHVTVNDPSELQRRIV